MPSVSKKQQKFMGIVRAIQKGDAPASKFSNKARFLYVTFFFGVVNQAFSCCCS